MSNKKFGYLVSETTLTDFLPYLFDGVHFWSGRRQVKQLYILRDDQSARFMPCCPIANHQNDILSILFAEFFQKFVHTSRVVIGHDQKK